MILLQDSFNTHFDVKSFSENHLLLQDIPGSMDDD